jgi:hypothetical protein
MIKVVFIWALLIITLFACKGGEEGQKPNGLVEGKGEEARESEKKDSLFPRNVTEVPEIVSVKLKPSSPKVDDVIKAEVLVSDDASAAYQWALNGKPLEISENSLSLREFKRGDKISLTVTPMIGNQEGGPVTVFTYIFNSPPKIVSHIKDSRYKDSNFIYEIRAADPDGDQLSYSLKSSLPGMIINPSTGMITWPVPPDFQGQAFFTVSVSDGNGGETIQNLSLNIEPEKKES